MPEALGALLRRLRRGRVVTVVYPSGDNVLAKSGPMSQNELARRSGVDAAAIHRVEAGTRHLPRRATLLALATALELDDEDTARLLVAAGYWPWPELEDAEHERVLGTALAVVRGDYRRLEATR